ncbi:DUF4407 domain-containing protein [Penaeicola halotolerans]|uniref:DUF4407 domain-containing protein n=1 Tax=Penaeicola halotolerans TaxID=2793196 RepID=UPI001CF8C92D|nr:DUF4407 domain-containing protein [Penaeicola halotolerans]
MNKLRHFLWLCSGAHFSLLKRAPTDTEKYAGIGATIFFTGLLAAISAGYALYTVFDQVWIAALFGLVWGLMIFNLDRYIVSSMKKSDQKWQEWKTATPRIFLAVLLAIVISKPLELKIFEKEIQAELIIQEQAIWKQQEDTLRARYGEQLARLDSQIIQQERAIVAQKAKRDQLEMLALQEADGTGGSRRPNLGPIYLAKKADANKADLELQAMELALSETQMQKGQLDQSINAEIIALERKPYNGLAAQLDALQILTKKSTAIFWANWFIMLLFIAIETAPVFVKLISSRGPYDDLLEPVEHNYSKRKVRLMAKSNFDTENYLEALNQDKSKEVARKSAQLHQAQEV